MERVEYTLGYIVFTVCVLFTPNEFRSAGLTVQNLFSSWIGSEDIGFIQFHLRRTALTLLIHCALPLGYYVGMCLAAPEENLFSIHSASSGWQLYFGLSATLQLFSVALVFYWSRNGWSNHPISHTLSKFALPQSSWRSVASSINTEFRRIEKFATGPPDARVIVTDTWVMKVTVYRLHVTLQQDAHLTVIDSKQHDMSPDSGTPVQILTLRVASINPNIKSFDIRRSSEYIYTDGRGVLEMRLNSTEYAELREKLHSPIRNAANVVVHLTLSELFLETFKSQVEMNQVYRHTSGQELEPCIGCMQVSANVKLVRLCRDEGECQQCYCRPMWCLVCMGKWFASRQDQTRPETWLSSTVACPTCRAKFCVLDICLVE
ncbi:E3 ubiquitin-protein ligase TM129 isoform X2 [Astyanax mexicanus]|uniref:E3 ubiquitin-protein ligase TM129 isoform X2 n=1 Tax=Astyanax mexicanus TaxID=7994 RepID=UPI0020CAF908|nr:E3 ubiquitin-protein ligase TM129 isoform X2 [Astyanax mexicanus]